MNKNLPNVYAVPINKKIGNNENTFRSSEERINTTPISINEIKKIFNDKNHVYKTKALIMTKNGKKTIDVVGITNNSILTLNGETIPINDILSIKKV